MMIPMIRWRQHAPNTPAADGRRPHQATINPFPGMVLAALSCLLPVHSGQAQSWFPLEIKTAAELPDPLGGGEGEQHPKGFARSESNPDLVYAGIDTGGTVMSADGGVTWVKNLDHGAYGKGYQSIAVDPNNPYVIYAHSEITTSNGGDMLHALEEYEGIYRSADGGDHWEQILSLPNPTTEAHGNYRIWRSMMTPVWSNQSGSTNHTTWYACYDQSGIWKIYDNHHSPNLPNPQLQAAEPDTDIFYWITHYTHAGNTYLLYGTEDGLFRRRISGGLSARAQIPVPMVSAPNGSNEMGGINYIYVNPVNPDEMWVIRRWDRPYRTLNGTSNNPAWTEVTPVKPDGSPLAWNAPGVMQNAVMAITPFAGGGHQRTVNDGGVNRTVPNRGFLSTSSHIFHLVWDGATPHWKRYAPGNRNEADFKKRPSPSGLSYLRFPSGAHAGFGFNPNDADDIAAFGASTFWKTDHGGAPLTHDQAWRHTGYGFTGYAVQIGIGGIHILDDNPSEKWFPWNDIGIGVTRDDAVSFAPIADIPESGKSNNTGNDEFYWKSSGNVVVNPNNPLKAVAHIGWYTGSWTKIGYTQDGGASWEVASTDPNHSLPNARIGGGAYVRLTNNNNQLKARAYMGPLYASDWTNTQWAELDPYQDRRGGSHEAPQSNRTYSVVGASAGDGTISPDNPTMYAMWTAGWSQILRGEPNWNKPSRFEWWSVLSDPQLSFKHPSGYPLVAVSPKNRDIVFGAVTATGSEPYAGTTFGQYVVRMNFKDATNSANPAFQKSHFFLPEQPGATSYNMVNDLAADPHDHRTVYVVTAAPGLPFVYKVRLNWNGTTTVTDLTGDLPRIGGSSITYDPSGGGRLLVSGFAGTWELRL